MRVLALGGSGGMGRFAVETSMYFDNVSEIVVADINAEEAIKFADSMNEKVSGIGLDVTDIDALKDNKVLSYSSASTMIVSPSPKIEFASNPCTIPPTINVGLWSDIVNIEFNIEEVVVFP